jgi:lysophospholipase L1-like esterase
MTPEPNHPCSTVPNPPRLRRGRRLLFIVIILSFFLILQELACRWLFPLPECAGFNRITYTPIRLFGGALEQARRRGLANVRLRWESEPDGFAFDHTLNLYGFRGPDFPLDPPVNRSRVLFVGDSYTEGAGADDENTLPCQFARLLETRRPVEAINLGVSGTGMRDYSLIARDGLSLLRPKALFLVVCWNDLPTLPLPEDVQGPAPEFPRLNPWVPRAAALIARWRAGEVVARRFPSGPYPFMSPVPSAANPLTGLKPPPADVDPEVLGAMRRGTANPWGFVMAKIHAKVLRHDYDRNGGVRDYLRYIASLCEQQGTRFVIVYIPHQVTVNPRYLEAQKRLGAPDYDPTKLDGPAYRAQQRHVARVTTELGVPFLDTTEELIAAEKSGGPCFWPIDGHCNAAGYRLLAEICARFWVDGPGSR